MSASSASPISPAVSTPLVAGGNSSLSQLAAQEVGKNGMRMPLFAPKENPLSSEGHNYSEIHLHASPPTNNAEREAEHVQEAIEHDEKASLLNSQSSPKAKQDLVGAATLAAGYAASDCSGQRWASTIYYGVVNNPKDNFTTPAQPLPAAENVLGAITSALVVYQELQPGGELRENPLTSQVMYVSRRAFESLNNVGLALYRGADIVYKAGVNVLAKVSNFCMIASFLAFSVEFGQKLYHSNKVISLLNEENLLSAAILNDEDKATVSALKKAFMDEPDRGKKAELLNNLKDKLSLILNKNEKEVAEDSVSYKTEKEVLAELTKVEIAFKTRNHLQQLKLGNELETLRTDPKQVNAVKTEMLKKAKMMRIASILVLIALAIGFAAIFVPEIMSAGQLVLIIVPSLWLLFNLIMLGVDAVDLHSTLNSPDFKEGKWDEKFAYARLFISLASVALFVGLGVHSGTPWEMLVINASIVGISNILIFGAVMKALKKARERDEAEKAFGEPSQAFENRPVVSLNPPAAREKPLRKRKAKIAPPPPSPVVQIF